MNRCGDEQRTVKALLSEYPYRIKIATQKKVYFYDSMVNLYLKCVFFSSGVIYLSLHLIPYIIYTCTCLSYSLRMMILNTWTMIILLLLQRTLKFVVSLSTRILSLLAEKQKLMQRGLVRTPTSGIAGTGV